MATVTILYKVLPDDDWSEADIEQADGQWLEDAIKEAGYTNHFYKLKED